MIPRLRAIARVGALLTCMNLLGAALYLPRARAAAEQFAVARGLQVLKQLGPVLMDTEQAMTINGQRMFLAARTTPMPMKEVLGVFERDCHENSGGIAEQLGQLPQEIRGTPIPEQLRDPARWFTLREEDEQAGQVTCFVRQSSEGGLSGLIARLSAFAKSGDLGELGDARYVVARHDASTGLTRVMALWTEGSFKVLELFPKQGDAPGSDSSTVPRPPNSVRVLSAQVPDKPYALRLYDSDETPTEILDHYQRMLPAQGWSQLPVPTTPDIDINDFSRTFTKQGRAAIVVVNTTPQQKSGVSLIELGNTGFANVKLESAP